MDKTKKMKLSAIIDIIKEDIHTLADEDGIIYLTEDNKQIMLDHIKNYFGDDKLNADLVANDETNKLELVALDEYTEKLLDEVI